MFFDHQKSNEENQSFDEFHFWDEESAQEEAIQEESLQEESMQEEPVQEEIKEEPEHWFFAPNDDKFEPQPPKRNGNGHFFRNLLIVLLCAVISFLSAASGVYWMSQNLLAENGATSNPTNISSAPKESDLHNSNPESVLSISDSEWSKYGSAGEDVFTISTVVAMVKNAVVVIEATVNDSNTGMSGTSSGSGVIVSKEGYILTCNHVVENATGIVVRVNSDKTSGGEVSYAASIVGTDEYTDLAVIKITPNNDDPLVYVAQGKSENLVVGEQVVAIGNPLGILGGTVTQGIISATERKVQTSDGIIMTLIQTDAAINSGNSGGGLFNLKGELIGIVNAKYSDTGVEGLGFAIPGTLAKDVELELIEKGYVSGRPSISFDVLEVNSTNLSSSLGYYYYYAQVCGSGLYVKQTDSASGLKQYDYISAINGVAITSKVQFNALLEQVGVGGTLSVTYKRVTLSQDWFGRISVSNQTSGTVEVSVVEKKPNSSIEFK